MSYSIRVILLLLAGSFFQPLFPVAHAGGGGPGCVGFFCQAAETWRSGVLAGARFGNEVTNRWMRNVMNIPLPSGGFEWTTLGNALGPALQNPAAARGLQIIGEAGLAVPLPILQAAGRVAGPALQYGRAAAELAAGETVIVRNAITGAVQKVAMGEAGWVTYGRVGKAAEEVGSQRFSQGLQEALEKAPSFKNRLVEKDLFNAEYNVYRDLSKTPVVLKDIVTPQGTIDLSSFAASNPEFNPRNARLLYAMNRSGEVRVWAEEGRYVLHSSLFGPQNRVVSAGVMEVVEGRITMIDRASGHFWPTEGSASLVTRVLGELKIPFAPNLVVEEAIGAMQ